MCDAKSLIEVIMVDGAKCRMAPKALHLFLAVNRVLKFRRSDGWATVGIDPIRKTPPKIANYHGQERRGIFSSLFGDNPMLPC